MSNTHRTTAGLTGRIAGAAVAGALFLGAPLVATLTLSTGVATAEPIDLPNFDFETCANGKKLADCDGDGLENWYEIKTLHTKAYLADTDGDGFDDGVEVEKGTNPLNSRSAPVDISGFDNFDFGF